jgi:hypothetical protein
MQDMDTCIPMKVQVHSLGLGFITTLSASTDMAAWKITFDMQSVDPAMTLQ